MLLNITYKILSSVILEQLKDTQKRFLESTNAVSDHKEEQWINYL
jgi:hypothetical protein